MLTGGCSESSVIATGRDFELASDRDEPLCAGTVDTIDAYLDAVADLLGETLPNTRFLRIEWRDVGDADGMTTDRLLRDDVIVTSDPIDPHELVHAAHLQVWPKSHRLLMEGLATMVGTRGWLQSESWPDGKPIDSVLGQWNGDYAAALYIVSQVVEEHDFEGLRSLWYAVPMGASASEFRDAYRSIFDQPIDHLVEPKMIGPVPATRLSCFYEIFLEPPQPLDASGQWQGRGPTECDDPATIGPRAAAGEVTAWTHQVVELPANAPFVTLVGGTGAVVRTCGFGCNAVVHDARIEPGAAVDLALPAGTYLVEIGESIDRLRHEDEAVLTLGSAD